MPDLAIACTGLVKHYADVVAVDGLDLVVPRGECFGLLGPNGAGKTTTVEILQGLTLPDAGTVSVLGLTWERDGAALKERLGTVLQETKFPDKLSVIELLRLFRSFYRMGLEIERALAAVNLEEKRNARVSKLSGGQRQRLAVAVALMADPDLLFLDEPTAGLDPQARRGLWDIILELRSRGRTVMLTTHYMDEAERLCDRVAVVDRGKVIALGSPRDLIAGLGAEHVVEFALEHGTMPAIAELETLPGVLAVRAETSAMRLTVTQVHEAIPSLMELLRNRDLVLSQLATHHATLEDVFLHLTGRRLRDE